MWKKDATVVLFSDEFFNRGVASRRFSAKSFLSFVVGAPFAVDPPNKSNTGRCGCCFHVITFINSLINESPSKARQGRWRVHTWTPRKSQPSRGTAKGWLKLPVQSCAFTWMDADGRSTPAMCRYLVDDTPTGATKVQLPAQRQLRRREAVRPRHGLLQGRELCLWGAHCRRAIANMGIGIQVAHTYIRVHDGHFGSRAEWRRIKAGESGWQWISISGAFPFLGFFCLSLIIIILFALGCFY
jgi:hypothetical protein